MQRKIEKFAVSVPEDVTGAVCGELVVKRDGLVLHMNTENGRCEIQAEMPAGSMDDFAAWLAEATDNRGTVESLDESKD